MSEAKHTPGPIEVCAPGDYGDYEGRCIVLTGDDRRIAVVLGTDEEAKANATLFAAAPELLEACRAMLSRYGSTEMGVPAVIMAEAAIKKAEGRS